MSKTLRWVFVLLPSTPGLILLLAGIAVLTWVGLPRDPNLPPDVLAAQRDGDVRAAQLCLAGGVVLVAGLVIGGGVAWRIAHPSPEPAEKDGQAAPTIK